MANGGAACVLFWTSWAIAALVTAIVPVFFVIGLAGGTVSSFEIGIWQLLLAGVGVVAGGGFALHANGPRALANGGVAAALRPRAVRALFFAVVLLSGEPRLRGRA